MKKTVFTGAGVAIVTPMNADGSINYDLLGTLIDYQIDNGTDAIVICGTTGESSTMTDDEHIECIRFAVEKVAHRVPVIAGAGSNDTAYACMLTKEAKQAGADAVLQVTPYYNKTSQRGVVKHFMTIADCEDIPNILYNVPSRTGMTIKPASYLELSKHPNIVATKEASGNFSDIAETAALCGEELQLYSGNDDQVVPMLALGGKGVISVLSNVAPKMVHDMVASFFAGDMETSRRIQLESMPLVKALFSDVNPIPVKAAVKLMGFPVGECRLPLAELGTAQLEQLKKAMKDSGIL